MRWLCMVLIALAVFLVGCVPGYAGEKSKANNAIHFGLGKSLEFGAETEGYLEGLETSSGTKIQKLQIKQSPARTIESWVGPMQVYDQQLATSWRGMTEHTTALLAGVSDIVAQSAPVLTQYLAARAQKPRMVSELAGLMGNPTVPIDALRSAIPEDVYKEALALAAKEVERLKSASP